MRAKYRNGRKFQPKAASLESRAAVSVLSLGGLLESSSADITTPSRKHE